MKITVELVEEFLNYYRNQNLKPDTIKNYERDFWEFLGLFSQKWELELENINMKIIEEWRTILRTTKTPKKSVYYGKKEFLSERTIQCKIQAVKKFLEFMNEIYDVWMNFRKIKVPKVRSQHHDFFEVNEIGKIIETIRSSEKYLINRIRSELLVVLWFTTGLRLSELLKLKVSEVLNWRTTIVWKWDKERFMWFVPESQNLLKIYLEEREKVLPRTKNCIWVNKSDDLYVFASHRLDNFWKPITPQTICWLNKKYNTNLNNLYNLHKKYTTHTLRSSAATHMLDQWANLREIQIFLWHEDLKTTETYLRIRNNQIAETQQRVFWDFKIDSGDREG